jgi:hypothetical protein
MVIIFALHYNKAKNMNNLKFGVVYKIRSTDKVLMSIDLPCMPTFIEGQIVELEQDVTVGAITFGGSNLRSYDAVKYTITGVSHFVSKHVYLEGSFPDDSVSIVYTVYLKEY